MSYEKKIIIKSYFHLVKRKQKLKGKNSNFEIATVNILIILRNFEKKKHKKKYCIIFCSKTKTTNK